MRDRTPPDPAAVRADYDAGADGFDARFHASRRTARAFQVIDAPQRAIARGRDRVLELGCGTGRLLGELDARTRVGADLSGGLLRAAAARGHVVLQADAHRLPFAAASFDAICAGNGVFRYLDYDAAFRECARVLRPGGKLAVHQYAARVWSARRPLRLPEGNPLHVDRIDELREPARRAGFTEAELFLWRTIRIAPYAVRLPERLAGRLWSHLTLVLERR